jgi:hypothetical protein
MFDHFTLPAAIDNLKLCQTGERQPFREQGY